MVSFAMTPILGVAAASITIAVLRRTIAEQDVSPDLVLASPQTHRPYTYQGLWAPTITLTRRNTLGPDIRYQPQAFLLLRHTGSTPVAL